MSRYFNCVFGDCIHIAIQAPKSFVVTDTLGRDWVCYPVKKCSRAQAKPFIAAQELANRIGATECGTFFTSVVAPKKALATMLSTLSMDCLEET